MSSIPAGFKSKLNEVSVLPFRENKEACLPRVGFGGGRGW